MVASASPGADPFSTRARAWRDGTHAAVCDVLEPWAHGTVVRATRYPRYFDFNVVRVEDEPHLPVQELSSFADQALAGLAHRRLDFDCISAGEQCRSELQARGWRTMRVLWMRYERSLAEASDARVEAVPYEAAERLRVLWHGDFAERPDEAYHAQAREVALSRGVQVLVIRAEGEPVAFAQLERDRSAAEITQVYVRPDHRGHGLGTAVTRGAIACASDARDLWICADQEERAKEIYARLGFSAVWTTLNCLRQLDPA